MIHLFICVHLLVPVRISLFRFCIIVQCTDSNHSQIICAKRCPMRRNEYEWKYGVNEWGWHIKFSRNSNSSNLCYQMTKCVSTPVIYDTHTHTYHPCDKSKRKCIAIAICRATAKLIVHEITREFICVLKWARGMMMCGCCCWHNFRRAKWEYIYLSATEPELGIMQNAMVEAAALRQILAHDLTWWGLVFVQLAALTRIPRMCVCRNREEHVLYAGRSHWMHSCFDTDFYINIMHSSNCDANKPEHIQPVRRAMCAGIVHFTSRSSGRALAWVFFVCFAHKRIGVVCEQLLWMFTPKPVGKIPSTFIHNASANNAHKSTSNNTLNQQQQLECMRHSALLHSIQTINLV